MDPHAINVHDQREAPHDATEGARCTDCEAPGEFDLNITETISIPPVLDVVGGPDQGVDEDEDIGEGDPEDQTAGGDVAIPKVPDKRWDGQHHGEEGQHG